MNSTLTASEIQRYRTELSSNDPEILLRLVPILRKVDPGELVEGDAEFVSKVEPLLRVGNIPLPNGADALLVKLVAQFARSWMTEETLEEFKTDCNNLTEGARQRSEESEHLRAEIVRLTKLNETLTGYLRLLDTLQPGIP